MERSNERRRNSGAGELTFQVQEDGDGHVLVKWTDGIECEFFAGGAVHDARCSSGALGITRYVVRSVLAYQQFCRSGDRQVTRPLPTVAEPLEEYDHQSNDQAAAESIESLSTRYGVALCGNRGRNYLEPW